MKAATKAMTVLVVEDDPELRQILVAMAAGRGELAGIEGIAVRQAASLEQALDRLDGVEAVIVDGTFPCVEGLAPHAGLWLPVWREAIREGARVSLFTADTEQYRLGASLFQGASPHLARAFEKPWGGTAGVEWAVNGVEFP